MGRNASVRLGLRVAVGVALMVVVFYLGRPLYWKLSASIQEVREVIPEEKQRDGVAVLTQNGQEAKDWRVRPMTEGLGEVVVEASGTEAKVGERSVDKEQAKVDTPGDTAVVTEAKKTSKKVSKSKGDKVSKSATRKLAQFMGT